MPDLRRRSIGIGEELGHGGFRRLGILRVQRIAQNKLDVRLIAGQAQKLSLRRANQQIDHLDLLRLAFSVLLNVGAGGENLNILKKSLSDGPLTVAGSA